MIVRRSSLALFTVVFVLHIGVASTAQSAEHRVQIRGMKYEPSSVAVSVGDTIVFTNADAAPHTATARDGSFDTGRLRQGESATVAIRRAGTFDYFCRLHSSMAGRVAAR